MSDVKQGTGNINYSFNKDNFKQIMQSNIFIFLPYYYILTIISVIYIISLRCIKNNKSEENNTFNYNNNYKNSDHYFHSITYNSPLNIMSSVKDTNEYTGLADHSYVIIIITYVITYLIILEGLLRNFVYSIYTNIIQVNTNNNPYNNPNCITKLNERPYISIFKNYSTIIFSSIIFFIPFLIPFIISFFKFDNYDIKHNIWFSYFILLLVFSPFILIIISRATFNKKLAIFPDLNRFVQPKDTPYVNFVSNTFNSKIYTVIIFIFIIFVFSYFNLMKIGLKETFKEKFIICFIIFILIFILIPIFLIFFSLSVIYINNGGDDDKNNVSSLYNLLVKYNYPCFLK